MTQMPINWVWRPRVELHYFAALIIQTVQHRLIDIQESPLISTEQDSNYDESLPTITLRRHSLCNDRSNATNFFEQQFAQHIQNNGEPIDSDWPNEMLHCRNDRRCHAKALNRLKHFNIIRHKCQYHVIPQQRRFKMVLRKTSSENELLLMTPTSGGPGFNEIPAIRRSFSSGLLF